VFDRRVLEHVGATGFQDIKENLIPKLHRAGERVVAHACEGLCPHVLNAQTYLAVNHWVLQRAGRGLGGDIVRHATARVEPGARLVGPVLLGAGVRVRAGATIVGPTSVGRDTVVGQNALLARSAVWSRCVVGEDSVVHGCVLGDGEVVPPAARLFNAVRPLHVQSPPRLPWWGPTNATAPTARPDPAFSGGLSGSVPTSCATA
jgi:NDP-sugar pyrophosphorylase family protein